LKKRIRNQLKEAECKKNTLKDVSLTAFELDRMTKKKQKVAIDKNIEKLLFQKIEKLIQVYDIDPKFYFHRRKIRLPFSSVDYKSLEPTIFETKQKGRIRKFIIEEK